MKSNDIEQLRAEIDRADASIVELIARRTALAAEIGKAKHQSGLPVFRPDRHMQVYRKVLAHLERAAGSAAPNELAGGLVHIYREIMSLGMAVEGDMKIAAPGAEHAAALIFGRSISPGASARDAAYLVFSAASCDVVLARREEGFRIIAAVEADGLYYAASRMEPGPSGKDRTVLAVPGSRPAAGAGELVFAAGAHSILDLPGYFQDAGVRERTEKLGATLLGCYPVLVEH